MSPLRFNISDASRKAFLQSIQVVAGITLVFTLVVGVLLAINYERLRSSDPMARELIDSLVLRLQDDPQNETLKNEIRQLDLLARKAYFSSQWQMKTGTGLFVGGVVVFAFCVFFHNRLAGRPRLPHANGQRTADDHWTLQLQRRWFLAVGAGLLFVVGLLGVVLPHMKQFPENGNAQALLDENKLETGQTLVDVALVDPMDVWPSFRGPEGNAIARVDKAPTHWDFESGAGIKWEFKVPKPGFNSPVVWGEQVFISGADESAQEIYCLNREDGSLVWTHTVGPIPDSEFFENPYYETGRAAPTLAVDGQYVCAIFANGNLICTDLNGNKIWATSLGVPENHYGHSSSLIIHDGLVFVQWDQSEDPRLLAYNLKDGSVAWQVNRYALSWSSPICVDTGSRYELILTDSRSVTSYNPQTGELYWQAGDVSGGEMGPSAFYHNGIVFAGTDFANFVAIELQSETDPKVLWEFSEHLPDTASIVGTDDFIFMATGYGVFACIDVKTGDLLWEWEAKDGFYGSPILVGDLIYVWDLEGNAYILKAEGIFHLIAEIPCGERVATTPAFVGKHIILRTQENLYCIEGTNSEEEGLE